MKTLEKELAQMKASNSHAQLAAEVISLKTELSRFNNDLQQVRQEVVKTNTQIQAVRE